MKPLPVSYTHLDVYKRQAYGIATVNIKGGTLIAEAKSLITEGTTYTPVSYTHLDVYKRQNGISEGNALNILKSEGFTMRKVCGPT